jgi:hypothetical protein
MLLLQDTVFYSSNALDVQQPYRIINSATIEILQKVFGSSNIWFYSSYASIKRKK